MEAFIAGEMLAADKGRGRHPDAKMQRHTELDICFCFRFGMCALAGRRGLPLDGFQTEVQK